MNEDMDESWGYHGSVDNLGISDNTYIFYTSDNGGEIQDEHAHQ